MPVKEGRADPLNERPHYGSTLRIADVMAVFSVRGPWPVR